MNIDRPVIVDCCGKHSAVEVISSEFGHVDLNRGAAGIFFTPEVEDLHLAAEPAPVVKGQPCAIWAAGFAIVLRVPAEVEDDPRLVIDGRIGSNFLAIEPGHERLANDPEFTGAAPIVRHRVQHVGEEGLPIQIVEADFSIEIWDHLLMGQRQVLKAYIAETQQADRIFWMGKDWRRFSRFPYAAPAKFLEVLVCAQAGNVGIGSLQGRPDFVQIITVDQNADIAALGSMAIPLADQLPGCLCRRRECEHSK